MNDCDDSCDFCELPARYYVEAIAEDVELGGTARTAFCVCQQHFDERKDSGNYHFTKVQELTSRKHDDWRKYYNRHAKMVVHEYTNTLHDAEHFHHLGEPEPLAVWRVEYADGSLIMGERDYVHVMAYSVEEAIEVAKQYAKSAETLDYQPFVTNVVHICDHIIISERFIEPSHGTR